VYKCPPKHASGQKPHPTRRQQRPSLICEWMPTCWRESMLLRSGSGSVGRLGSTLRRARRSSNERTISRRRNSCSPWWGSAIQRSRRSSGLYLKNLPQSVHCRRGSRPRSSHVFCHLPSGANCLARWMDGAFCCVGRGPVPRSRRIWGDQRNGTEIGTQRLGKYRDKKGLAWKVTARNLNEMGRLSTSHHHWVCPKLYFKTGALNRSATLPNH
jgi:hypothetical protein